MDDYTAEWLTKLDRGKPKAVESDDNSKPLPRSNTELIAGKQRGRPQTITDMKAYRAQKARERRAKKASNQP